VSTNAELRVWNRTGTEPDPREDRKNGSTVLTSSTKIEPRVELELNHVKTGPDMTGPINFSSHAPINIHLHMNINREHAYNYISEVGKTKRTKTGSMRKKPKCIPERESFFSGSRPPKARFTVFMSTVLGTHLVKEVK
jgi:hypothetical protein